jgi:hypothetical protein
MTWLHVQNNTGAPLTLYFGSYPQQIAPGKWCLSSGTPPHCQPKERP